MAKLKIGALPNDKPVKVTVELPAAVHRDLVAYAGALARETGQPVNDPSKLIAPMLTRFMATDRDLRNGVVQFIRQKLERGNVRPRVSESHEGRGSRCRLANVPKSSGSSAVSRRAIRDKPNRQSWRRYRIPLPG